MVELVRDIRSSVGYGDDYKPQAERRVEQGRINRPLQLDDSKLQSQGDWKIFGRQNVIRT